MPQPRKYRRWNQAEVLQEIKNLIRVSPGYIRDEHSSLYGAAIRLFGSWRAAIMAAGLSHEQTLSRKAHKYWTKTRVIAELGRLENRRSSEVKESDIRLYSAAIRLFGGWSDAMREVGLDCERLKERRKENK